LRFAYPTPLPIDGVPVLGEIESLELSSAQDTVEETLLVMLIRMLTGVEVAIFDETTLAPDVVTMHGIG
jgi:hypothetical protein